MKDYLSPREVAEALAVSESSVKRWADAGLIAATRTDGGHRRIPLEEAVRFVRESNAPVTRPEMLGFAEAAQVPWQHLSERELQEQLYEALVRGLSERAFGLIHGPFLGARPLAWLFDGPVRTAMHRLGELWMHQGDGILLEHRATDICLQAVMRIRLSLPLNSQAPESVGGSPPGDPYMLPTLMAATVLREAGMRETNLGPQTPLNVLRSAVEKSRPRLCWVSVSVEKSARDIHAELVGFSEYLSARGVTLVVGGRAVEELADLQHPNLTVGQSMAELATFARGMMASRHMTEKPLAKTDEDSP